MVSLGAFAGGAAGGATVTVVIRAVDQFSKTFGKAETKLGKFNKLATGATVGILAIGAAFTGIAATSVKVASDFEETSAKFGTIFRDVSKEADAVAKDLQQNFGLSSLAAKELLSNTGDLLTGFNFTGEAALDMAEQVNKLAVDLASFSNASGGAEAVSRSLTKALLGERESLKTYGIAILDADVNQRVFTKGQGDLIGEALRQAKAVATLELAFEQSKNAVGDFARTQDSLANQSRILQGRFEDMRVEIGNLFLPVATELVTLLAGGLGPILAELKPAIELATVAFTDLFTQLKESGQLEILIKGLVGVIVGATTLFALFLRGIMVISEFIELGVEWGKVLADAVTPALTTVFNAAKKVFSIISDVIGKIKDFISLKDKVSIGGAIGGFFGKTSKVDDFILQPGGRLIETNPNDTIVGAKNPANLGGGGGTVTINIEQVNGTDPEEMARALKIQLSDLVTT